MELNVKNGGPKTEKGKLNSRQNALKHGLTAKTLIEEACGAEKLDYVRNSLTRELKPVTFIQETFVARLAECLVKSDLCQVQSDSVLKYNAEKTDELTSSPEEAMKLILESPGYNLASRYKQSALREFLRLLKEYRSLDIDDLTIVVDCQNISDDDDANEGNSPDSGLLVNKEALLAEIPDENSATDFLVNHFPEEIRQATSSKPASFLAEFVGEDADYLNKSVSEALKKTFIGNCKITPHQAIVLAVELLTDPNAPANYLRKRSGVRNRRPIEKVCKRAHAKNGKDNDWLLEGLGKILGLKTPPDCIPA